MGAMQHNHAWIIAGFCFFQLRDIIGARRSKKLLLGVCSYRWSTRIYREMGNGMIADNLQNCIEGEPDETPIPTFLFSMRGIEHTFVHGLQYASTSTHADTAVAIANNHRTTNRNTHSADLDSHGNSVHGNADSSAHSDAHRYEHSTPNQYLSANKDKCEWDSHYRCGCAGHGKL